MRRLLALLGGFAALTLCLGFAFADQPQPITTLLDNGLLVTIVEVPDNTVVATRLWYHVGSAHEDPDSRGFAHLFEHLMFGRTENHAKDEYADYHHRNGGYENAYTSFDETVYISDIAPEHHRGVLEFEADRMVNLVVDEENLEREKKIVSEELRMRMENSPLVRVEIAALKAALGEHPYAHTPGGTREDVGAATLEQCQRFYRDSYGPSNAHLVIVGPVDGEQTLASVREFFGGLPASGRRPAEVLPLVGREYPRLVELEEDLPPVETVLAAYPLPAANSEDATAVSVLQTMLADSKIDLFEEELVRRRKKAVYARTETLEARSGGTLLFAAAFLPHRSQKKELRYVNEAVAHLKKLDWLTESALAAAKRKMIRRELSQAYYPAVRAQAIARAEWWQGDGALATQSAARIEAVDRDAVAAAFNRYIAGAEPIRVYIEPERVPIWVRLFGWLHPLVD